jgi:polyphosphate kinase
MINDFNKPEYFFNRELSWLKFNLRVLKEAEVENIPLLERLRFVAISASNLDEFFMVRVAGLHSQLEGGLNKKDAAGLSVEDQLREISLEAHEQMQAKYQHFFALVKKLQQEGVVFKKPKDLSVAGAEWLENYYQNVVYPVLTPMAVDASRPFPFLANKSLNLVLELINRQKEPSMAFVQVPSVLPRIITVEEGPEQTAYVYLEDLIMAHCPELFKGCKITTVAPFRITRDSDLAVDEDETEDLLKEIEKSLRKRKRGAAVRLEIDQSATANVKNFLIANLDLTAQQVYEIRGPLDLTFLFKFFDLPGMDKWQYPPFVPQAPAEVDPNENLFTQIKEHDILLHHPYESFEPVIKLVAQAAVDPEVLAIKQTLYRVSGNSPIVAALAKAAENGKQVTVLVELKARFDEENNIVWARRLEEAGCHVIYGLVGLKTHSKIILIVRKEEDGIKRYVHLGTGNYNDKTAKLYTDIGLMTANDEFGTDASAFFNVLSGYSEPPVWNKLVMAPLGLRQKFYELIDREIKNAQTGKEAHLIAKMNSLIDQPVIEKLYQASCAGVKIELIVRGICGLRPGVAGVSDNITVRSIIGKFLEHSRIFWFANDGQEEVYLSSADWMPRNLNDRVELLFPVESSRHVQKIKHILQLCLTDNVGAHIMQSNGIYRRPSVKGKKGNISVQAILTSEACAAAKQKEIPMEERLRPMYRKD